MMSIDLLDSWVRVQCAKYTMSSTEQILQKTMLCD
jgi:hypothetical protein